MILIIIVNAFQKIDLADFVAVLISKNFFLQKKEVVIITFHVINKVVLAIQILL